jgi:hypothetical protein
MVGKNPHTSSEPFEHEINMNYISTQRTLPLLTITALVETPNNRVPFVGKLHVFITSTYIEAVFRITLHLQLTGLHGYGKAWFLSDVTASIYLTCVNWRPTI